VVASRKELLNALLLCSVGAMQYRSWGELWPSNPTWHTCSAPFSGEGCRGANGGLGTEDAVEHCAQLAWQTAQREEVLLMGWHKVLSRM